MLLDRRLLRNLDHSLVFGVLALCLVGFAIVFSATRGGIAPGSSQDPLYFLKRQVAAFVLGSLGCVAILTMDYRLAEKAHRVLYVGNICLLALVLVVGHRISGAQSWFRLGPVAVQPSELAKVALILTLAHHLAEAEDVTTHRGLVLAFAHAAIPAALVLLQNDLGTALVFGGITFAMLYVAGAKAKDLLAVLAAGTLASPVVFFFLLKDYQRARLLAFLNPYADPTGTGYNVIQSTIAIGSGRFFGKGLFHGTQAQLNFLPAHHTDFIFSVIGEELGFIGAVAVLALYGLVLWRCVRTAACAKDAFGRLVATGVAAMLLFHVLVNVGMTMSLMPVTGIPLPFLSYGGSSLMANLIAVGFVLDIYMRRQKILF
ncbi:MAG: rod shape-determining protein RodA [Bacteroidota bacterium]